MLRVVAFTTIGVVLALVIAAGSSREQPADPRAHPDVELFFQATAQDGRRGPGRAPPDR